MRGAGGTSGGIGHFLIGIVMMCAGFYLLLNSITVSSSFGSGARLWLFDFWFKSCNNRRNDNVSFYIRNWHHLL